MEGFGGENEANLMYVVYYIYLLHRFLFINSFNTQILVFREAITHFGIRISAIYLQNSIGNRVVV